MKEATSEAIKCKIFYGLLRMSIGFSVCFIKACGTILSDKDYLVS